MLPVVKFSDEKFREQADKVLADKVSAGETITSLDFKLALRAQIPGVYVAQDDISKYLKEKFKAGEITGYQRKFDAGHFEYTPPHDTYSPPSTPVPDPNPPVIPDSSVSSTSLVPTQTNLNDIRTQCPNCLGVGVDPDSGTGPLQNCTVCGGSGQVSSNGNL